MFVVYFLINDYISVIEYGRKFFVIFYNSGEKVLESKLSLELVNLYYYWCKYFEVKIFCWKVILICREIGECKGEVLSNELLGIIFLFFGEYIKVIENFERFFEIREEIGDRIGLVLCYGNLGSVFYFWGEYCKVKEYIEKVLLIKKENDDRRGEVVCYG